MQIKASLGRAQASTVAFHPKLVVALVAVGVGSFAYQGIASPDAQAVPGKLNYAASAASRTTIAATIGELPAPAQLSKSAQPVMLRFDPVTTGARTRGSVVRAAEPDPAIVPTILPVAAVDSSLEAGTVALVLEPPAPSSVIQPAAAPLQIAQAPAPSAAPAQLEAVTAVPQQAGILAPDFAEGLAPATAIAAVPPAESTSALALAPVLAPNVGFTQQPIVQAIEPAVPAASPPESALAPVPAAAAPTGMAMPIIIPAPATLTLPVKISTEARGIALAPARLAMPVSKPRATAPAAQRGVKSAAPRYAVSATGIDFTINAMIDGAAAGTVPLRIGANEEIAIRLADVLALLRSRMGEAEYQRLSSAAAASEYASFAAIRAAGIGIRYDAAHDQLLLGGE